MLDIAGSMIKSRSKNQVKFLWFNHIAAPSSYFQPIFLVKSRGA